MAALIDDDLDFKAAETLEEYAPPQVQALWSQVDQLVLAMPVMPDEMLFAFAQARGMHDLTEGSSELPLSRKVLVRASCMEKLLSKLLSGAGGRLAVAVRDWFVLLHVDSLWRLAREPGIGTDDDGHQATMTCLHGIVRVLRNDTGHAPPPTSFAASPFARAWTSVRARRIDVHVRVRASQGKPVGADEERYARYVRTLVEAVEMASSDEEGAEEHDAPAGIHARRRGTGDPPPAPPAPPSPPLPRVLTRTVGEAVQTLVRAGVVAPMVALELSALGEASHPDTGCLNVVDLLEAMGAPPGPLAPSSRHAGANWTKTRFAEELLCGVAAGSLRRSVHPELQPGRERDPLLGLLRSQQLHSQRLFGLRLGDWARAGASAPSERAASAGAATPSAPPGTSAAEEAASSGTPPAAGTGPLSLGVPPPLARAIRRLDGQPLSRAGAPLEPAAEAERLRVIVFIATKLASTATRVCAQLEAIRAGAAGATSPAQQGAWRAKIDKALRGLSDGLCTRGPWHARLAGFELIALSTWEVPGLRVSSARELMHRLAIPVLVGSPKLWPELAESLLDEDEARAIGGALGSLPGGAGDTFMCPYFDDSLRVLGWGAQVRRSCTSGELVGQDLRRAPASTRRASGLKSRSRQQSAAAHGGAGAAAPADADADAAVSPLAPPSRPGAADKLGLWESLRAALQKVSDPDDELELHARELVVGRAGLPLALQTLLELRAAFEATAEADAEVERLWERRGAAFCAARRAFGLLEQLVTFDSGFEGCGWDAMHSRKQRRERTSEADRDGGPPFLEGRALVKAIGEIAIPAAAEPAEPADPPAERDPAAGFVSGGMAEPAAGGGPAPIPDGLRAAALRLLHKLSRAVFEDVRIDGRPLSRAAEPLGALLMRRGYVRALLDGACASAAALGAAETPSHAPPPPAAAAAAAAASAPLPASADDHLLELRILASLCRLEDGRELLLHEQRQREGGAAEGGLLGCLAALCAPSLRGAPLTRAEEGWGASALVLLSRCAPHPAWRERLGGSARGAPLEDLAVVFARRVWATHAHTLTWGGWADLRAPLAPKLRRIRPVSRRHGVGALTAALISAGARTRGLLCPPSRAKDERGRSCLDPADAPDPAAPIPLLGCAPALELAAACVDCPHERVRIAALEALGPCNNWPHAARALRAALGLERSAALVRTLASLGGDCFAALAPGYTDEEEDARAVAELELRGGERVRHAARGLWRALLGHDGWADALAAARADWAKPETFNEDLARASKDVQVAREPPGAAECWNDARSSGPVFGGGILRRCTHCAAPEAKPGALKACGGCKTAKFCGAACLRAAWKAGHKRECARLAAAARAGGGGGDGDDDGVDGDRENDDARANV